MYKNQQEMLRHFNEEKREQFNDKLFERDEFEIIKMLEKIILSCERNRYFTLKVKKFDVIVDYEEVWSRLREHEENRLSKKKDIDNIYDYIPLGESDIMLLEVVWSIKINTPRKPDDDISAYERELPVLIAIPRYVDTYYMKLNGTYYIPKIQIVDKSVYNNSNSSSGRNSPSITQKTMFQPIRMYRCKATLTTSTGENVDCIIYTTNIFSKTMDGMKYILARYGLDGAMQFLDIPYVYVSDIPSADTDEYYSFGTKCKDVFIVTPKYIFDNEVVVQSLIATIVRNINRFHSEVNDGRNTIMDPRFWVCSLGGEFNAFSLDKGIPVLDSLEDSYDLITMDSLRLPFEEKKDIYTILRWMFREFNILRGKDINDITTKRARIAEYFANMYAVRMSKGLYRITDLGKSVTMEKIIGAIYTKPMYLAQAASDDNKLLIYRDMVNDNDAITALSFTYKGISGLGDRGGDKKKKVRKAAVPLGIKLVQPAQLGITDLDTSSPSDPGVTGMMCPMAPCYDDGSFIQQDEPNSWMSSWDELKDIYYKAKGLKESVKLRKMLNIEYDKVKEDMIEETLITFNKLICPVSHKLGMIDYSRPPVLDNSSDVMPENNDVIIGNDMYGDFVQVGYILEDPTINQYSYMPTPQQYNNPYQQQW